MQDELAQQKAAAGSGAGGGDVSPALESLPLIPYINAEGKISSTAVTDKVKSKSRQVVCNPFFSWVTKIFLPFLLSCFPQVKASVYAIYDEAGTVQYIGVSRGVEQSLRLHLARMPDKTYGVKAFHITKPSRVLLEMTRETWMKELGYTPEVGSIWIWKKKKKRTRRSLRHCS